MEHGFNCEEIPYADITLKDIETYYATPHTHQMQALDGTLQIQ
jgi:hypothetical protein